MPLTDSFFTGAVKVLSAAQIQQADQHTITHEPVSSLDLMERAASLAAAEIEKRMGSKRAVDVVCGPGNNGGDGLVIARLLHQRGFKVSAFLVNETGKLSGDCRKNAERLTSMDASLLKEITGEGELPDFKGEVMVDALFGTGISRKITGVAATVIEKINRSKADIVSVDLPSGLFADEVTPAEFPVVHAGFTITFQCPKLCFFFSMNESFIGEWKVIDIGLDRKFIASLDSAKYYVTQEQVARWVEPRSRFSHKGNFGHALLIAGSEGMMGAAVLSAMACLRTGTGLLTVHVPKSGVAILQSSLPEALVHADQEEHFFSGVDEKEITKATAIAAGPGLSQDLHTQEGVRKLTGISKPLLLDADALNILSLHKEWLKQLPANTILTPHPKEFERLEGKTVNDFEKHERQLTFSKKYGVITVLKGAHTCIAFPDGSCCFNSTGNPAMATAGSGDVLTGVILGLLSQNFSPGKAAIAGVYLHGLAGDLAAKEGGSVGMLASDIARNIPHAFDALLQASPEK